MANNENRKVISVEVQYSPSNFLEDGGDVRELGLILDGGHPVLANDTVNLLTALLVDFRVQEHRHVEALQSRHTLDMRDQWMTQILLFRLHTVCEPAGEDMSHDTSSNGSRYLPA